MRVLYSKSVLVAAPLMCLSVCPRRRRNGVKSDTTKTPKQQFKRKGIIVTKDEVVPREGRGTTNEMVEQAQIH